MRFMYSVFKQKNYLFIVHVILYISLLFLFQNCTPVIELNNLIHPRSFVSQDSQNEEVDEEADENKDEDEDENKDENKDEDEDKNKDENKDEDEDEDENENEDNNEDPEFNNVDHPEEGPAPITQGL